MPSESNMIIVRPKNCHYCIHGYNALNHILQHAQSKFNVRDLSGTNANQTPIYDALDEFDPKYFYGFGHGLSCKYTGDSEEEIFSCYNCDKLSERVVYLLSCLTAIGLGPEIIKKGALAYAGFNISWTWIADEDNDGNFKYQDPYNDPYALCFYESANELWKAIIDGKTFHDAVQQSRDKYDEWIDYWFYDKPQDPYSQECIKWLAHDRDGLISLDACGSINDEQQCIDYGCEWVNDRCMSRETQQTDNGIDINPMIILPIAMIGGLAYLAFKK